VPGWIIRRANYIMQQNTITYREFALRVFLLAENGIYQAIDSVTGKVLHTTTHKPYYTLEGANAYFQTVYNVKKNELN